MWRSPQEWGQLIFQWVRSSFWCDDMHYLGWALPAMYDHVATVLEGLPDH